MDPSTSKHIQKIITSSDKEVKEGEFIYNLRSRKNQKVTETDEKDVNVKEGPEIRTGESIITLGIFTIKKHVFWRFGEK